MKRKTSKWLSLFLAIAMVVSLGISTAFAATADYVDVALEERQIKVTPGASHGAGAEIRIILYKADLTLTDAQLKDWSTISGLTEDGNWPAATLTENVNIVRKSASPEIGRASCRERV